MFFSSRVVPQTPPSLVKFSSRARGVMTGASSSVPSSDHVPELRNARWPLAADGRHRRPGVVAGGRDDARAGEAPRRVAADRADDGARLDHRRQQPRRHVERLAAGRSPTIASAHR